MTPDAAGVLLTPFGFQWSELDRKTDLRCVAPKPAKGTSPADAKPDAIPVSLFGATPMEVALRFQDEKFTGLMALFYTRGDSGDMPIEEFQTLAASLSRELDTWAGSKGIPQKEDRRSNGGVINRGIWTRNDVRVDLESGYTQIAGRANRPEFVRLRILPFDPSQRAQLLGGQVAREQPKSNEKHGVALAQEIKKGVEERSNGDRVIAVPMVDQGPKGYCVAAVMERVARFYGKVFDQHEAAQIANTGAASGTSSDNLVKALRSMSRMMKMNCTGRTDIDDTVTRTDMKRRLRFTVPKDFEDMLKTYNREAKKSGLREYEIWDALDLGGIDIVYAQLDKDTLRKARLTETVKADQFKTEIKKRIDTGVPVVWVVMIGIVSEGDRPTPSGLVGHMRMIVGYNAKTSEFIYSDSWGPGHEEKRMSMDDAWVMNRGYFAVTPQGTRL